MSRVLRFVSRHAWSVSLTALSTLSFGRLAREMSEGELDAFDQAASAWLTRGRGVLDAPMLALTRFGTVVSLTTLCVASVLGLLLGGRRREAAFVAACGAGAAVWCSALKLAFQRVRPGETALYLITTPGSFSFPSGHAMGTAGVLGSLVVVVFALRAPRLWRTLAVVVALPVIFGVAISRVYFGVHYPSDIIGGQLAAAAWVAAVTGWFYPRLLPNEAASASPEPRR